MGDGIPALAGEGVVDPTSPALRGHQARVTQHGEVVGQQGTGHLDAVAQLAHAPGAERQLGHHPQPGRVTQRPEARRDRFKRD